MRRRRRVRLTRPVTSPRDRTGGIREDRAEPRSGARLHFCARTRRRHMGAHIAVGADLPDVAWLEQFGVEQRLGWRRRGGSERRQRSRDPRPGVARDPERKSAGYSGPRGRVREAGAVVGRPAAAPPGPKPGLDYKWIASGVVVVGALMSILNQTVVNVALPTLESDFNVSLTDIQCVVTSYALGLAAVIPLTGWLADRYGTKRVFLVSQILFALSSILCALAWSDASLIAFRVVQGLAGGLIMPIGMTILMMVSRPEERGLMMSVMGVPMLLGPVLGPLLGGWLVQGVSWRLIFVINVPIGVVGALLSALYLRGRGGSSGSQRPDLGGLILGVPAVAAIVYGLSQPSSKGWGSAETILPLVGGAVLLVAFYLYELRQQTPLIEMRVFRDAAFSAAMLVNF